MSKTALPEELQGLLNANPALKRLARAVRRQAPDTVEPPQRALGALPAALRDRVTLVEEEHHWLAMVETSATAQMLRFHLPRLEKALPAKGVKILVTGRRGPASVARPQRPAPSLDRDSAEHIRRAAESIEDKGLRDALNRLAGRGE